MIIKIFCRVIPFGIFLTLVLFLFMGLKHDPRQLPSTLINKPLPAFDLLTDSKTHFTNQQLLGHVSLLTVWASGCENCRAEHPILMDLARDKTVALYGIDYKDNQDEAQRWLQNYGNPYLQLGFDEDGKTSIDLGVYGTPETFVIDKEGIVRYKLIGQLTSNILHEQILPLIAKLNGVT